VIEISQVFGNCPQYIASRMVGSSHLSYTWVDDDVVVVVHDMMFDDVA